MGRRPRARQPCSSATKARTSRSVLTRRCAPRPGRAAAGRPAAQPHRKCCNVPTAPLSPSAARPGKLQRVGPRVSCSAAQPLSRSAARPEALDPDLLGRDAQVDEQVAGRVREPG
jgi:hypothetical protein